MINKDLLPHKIEELPPPVFEKRAGKTSRAELFDSFPDDDRLTLTLSLPRGLCSGETALVIKNDDSGVTERIPMRLDGGKFPLTLNLGEMTFGEGG